MVLTDLKKELMTDKASFRAIIEQWPTVKCYNIKRFLQFSASTKPHDKTLICYYFLSSGCAKGKTKKLKIVLSKYKTKLKIDLSKYILYFHHRQISVDCWQSHLIQRGKTFSLKLNSTKCGWESIDDAPGGFLKNHDTFIQSSCKKICNYSFGVHCSFFQVLVLVIVDHKLWQKASKKQYIYFSSYWFNFWQKCFWCLIQICVDKSQRRFQFSAAHFQEFIDGEWEELFLCNLCGICQNRFYGNHLRNNCDKNSCMLCIWHWAWSCFVLIRRRLKVYDASSLSQKLHKPHLGWGLLHKCCIFRNGEMLASFLIRIISRNWGCGKNFWRMLPNSPMFAKALKYITVWWGGARPHTDFKVHKRKMMKF